MVRTSSKRCVICGFISNEYNVQLPNCCNLLLDRTKQIFNYHPSFRHFHCIRSMSITKFMISLESSISDQYPIVLVHMIAPNSERNLVLDTFPVAVMLHSLSRLVYQYTHLVTKRPCANRKNSLSQFFSPIDLEL